MREVQIQEYLTAAIQKHTGAYMVCKRSKGKNSYDRSDNGYDKDKGIICHRFFHKVKPGLSFIKDMQQKGSTVVV